MDADKKRIWIRGQFVEVTDEVYRAYMQGDRKMRYFENDLKTERFVLGKEGQVVQIIPSREDSLDRLVDGHVVYSLDFEVTPHMLRHTYITNLIHASVDPKTVQYLAGHESSKITMDIYAKVKYNKPEQLAGVLSGAFAEWDGGEYEAAQ